MPFAIAIFFEYGIKIKFIIRSTSLESKALALVRLTSGLKNVEQNL